MGQRHQCHNDNERDGGRNEHDRDRRPGARGSSATANEEGDSDDDGGAGGGLGGLLGAINAGNFKLKKKAEQKQIAEKEVSWQDNQYA